VVGPRFEILVGICEKLLAEAGNDDGTVDVGKQGLFREKNFELLSSAFRLFRFPLASVWRFPPMSLHHVPLRSFHHAFG